MRRLLAVLTFAAPAAAQVPSPDSASFVTRLGADTLVVERFVRTARRVEADVVLRVPRTTRTRYVLELTPAGEWLRMESVRDGRRETITRAGDSLRIAVVTDSGRRDRAVAAQPGVLPFIDFVHWPYELALLRLRAADAPTQGVPLLTGRRTTAFAFAAVGADSVTITHPGRGTMRARVDAAGRLHGLDARATTRKLVVERRPWMALDPIAARWQANDAAGRAIGALSGRAVVTGTVAGATVRVDHGTPAKRGRAIWGGLVPYGQVWRTGANAATHFTTDRALILGAGEQRLTVPAGRYTLFSIPAPDGGVLIVSRDTGQAGTAYDATRDLGRVPLQARPLVEPVEVFTIAISGTGDPGGEGAIRLQWDETELVAPFRVAPRSQ